MNSYAIFPSGVAECAHCGCDVTSDNVGAFRRVSDLGPNASVCLTYCEPCAAAADAERERTAAPTQKSIALSRRGIGSHVRRHPAYGKKLADSPPLPDEPLNVAIGWTLAKILPEPLLVVLPEDNPGKLRFDVAAGRRVRVAHPADADADQLLSLAQALIDFGALSIKLVVHPPRPGANGVESLLVVPEAEA